MTLVGLFGLVAICRGAMTGNVAMVGLGTGLLSCVAFAEPRPQPQEELREVNLPSLDLRRARKSGLA